MGQGASHGGELGRVPHQTPEDVRGTAPIQDDQYPPVEMGRSGGHFGDLPIDEIVSLHSGSYTGQVFAITTDQRVYGWGRNDKGQTIDAPGVPQAPQICDDSNGNDNDRAWRCLVEPERIDALSNVRLASAGGEQSCFFGTHEDAPEASGIYCMGRRDAALGLSENGSEVSGGHTACGSSNSEYLAQSWQRHCSQLRLK